MTTPQNDRYELSGRVCVVTGGGSGIGQGIAIALAAEGAKVAILDKNEAGTRETLGLLKGGEGMALACDVTDQTSVEAAAAAIKQRFGDIQVLVTFRPTWCVRKYLGVPCARRVMARWCTSRQFRQTT
ncbi:MAG: hypothetical protein RLZZ371_845 [Pseudomonadota bacterium]